MGASATATAVEAFRCDQGLDSWFRQEKQTVSSDRTGLELGTIVRTCSKSMSYTPLLDAKRLALFCAALILVTAMQYLRSGVADPVAKHNFHSALRVAHSRAAMASPRECQAKSAKAQPC